VILLANSLLHRPKAAALPKWQVLSRRKGEQDGNLEFASSLRCCSDPNNPVLGSGLHEWLVEEGIANEVETSIFRSILAWEVARAMKARNLPKVAAASELGVSLKQFKRRLDRRDASAQIQTLIAAAKFTGESKSCRSGHGACLDWGRLTVIRPNLSGNPYLR
jgi:hypothetical protein